MAGIPTVDLTTLENCKLIVGVSESTTYDALLTLLVSRVSRRIIKYLGRKLHYEEYTEFLAPTGRQLLLLEEWPIMQVVSVIDKGYTLIFNTDYRCDKQDAMRGVLYKEDGWQPVGLVSGLTSDVQASARLTSIDYMAGYVFPLEDTYQDGLEPDFTIDIPGSLPLDIQQVADEMVAEIFIKSHNSAFGVTQIKEGNVMLSYRDASVSTELGISDEHAEILNGYRREVIA